MEYFRLINGKRIGQFPTTKVVDSTESLEDTLRGQSDSIRKNQPDEANQTSSLSVRSQKSLFEAIPLSF